MVGKLSASVFWDISQFYDSIDLCKLVGDVEEHGFPLLAGAMALQAHTGERLLKIDESFGPFIRSIGRGILAGCTSSTSFARLFLASPLRKVVDASADISVGVHVDDVSQTCTDVLEDSLSKRAVASGIALADAVTERGLAISSKSVVVSSNVRISRRISQQLASSGYAVKTQLWTDDLGIGFRPGRRSAATIKHRLKLGLARACRAYALRRLAGSAAAKLFSTGVMPAATYGQTVTGLSARQRETLLASAKKVAGPCGMSPCTKSQVIVKLGILPTVQAQVSQLRLWWKIWAISQNRAELTKAWRVFRDSTANLPEARGWERASGPIAATILVLRAAQWDPIQTDRWLAPGERFATLSAPEPHAEHDVMAAVEQDLSVIYWKQAAGHFMGSGLEQGMPCFEPFQAARKHLLKLIKVQGSPAAGPDTELQPRPAPSGPESAAFRAAALDAVVAGGATVGCRFNPPRPCPRCGALAETPLHRYFECEGNKDAALLDIEPAIGKTQWMAEKVMNPLGQRPFEPCFWARGILPAGRMQLLATAPQDRCLELGSIKQAARVSDEIYTDGSGGPKWVVSPLRRAGAGGAAFAFSGGSGEQHLSHIGLLFASVPGRQTVPRAETWAGTQTLIAADRDVGKWWSDAIYTVRGAQASARRSRSSGANGDIWVSLYTQLDGARRLEGPSKVKAHQSLDAVINGDIAFEQYLGNSLADIAADLAGLKFQEPPPVVQEAERAFGTCVLVCKRLAAIEAACWHASSRVMVPAPVFEAVPEVPDIVEAMATARSKFAATEHRLYAFKAGLACHRCQQYRSTGKAHQWSRLRCLPRRDLRPAPEPFRSDDGTASNGRTAEGGPFLGDDDWFLQGVQDQEDYETLSGQSMEVEGPPDQFEGPPLVSAEVAQREKRNHVRALKDATSQIRDQVARADSQVATGAAAHSHTNAVADGAVVDAEAFPAWSALADDSHDLLTLGGIVICCKCGSMALSDIRHSLLTRECRRQLSADGRKDLRRLCLGQRPSRVPEWPDGGFDASRNGAEIRRLRGFFMSRTVHLRSFVSVCA